MRRNNYFKFKQFVIVQKYSAMKVGIDGVLIGAWADISGARSILDVGTGTGLIAIMMAQRSDAAITAVEIDKPAADEAEFNFAQSPWKERIKLYQTSFQEFAASTQEKFDLIVSNPPFFENGSQPNDSRRINARHTNELSYEELIDGSSRILSENGKIALIIPAEKAQKFIDLAQRKKLFPNRLLQIRPNPIKPPHRFMLDFSRMEKTLETGELIIEKAVHHDFTEEYMALTKDFYLNF